MVYFHFRCGERITLLNENCTAVRNDSDFDNGLVITAEPLVNDVLFEIKIDRKVNSWSGSLEIGVVECDPMHFDFPACSSKIQAPSWIMSGPSFFKNANCVIERYGSDLDKLGQEERVGLMRTSEGDLIFYVNGESQGVAAENLPSLVYGLVDVYGKCVQITVTSPALSVREHNNDDCLSGSSVLAIDNDILNVTLGGDLSELSMSSSNSLDIRMEGSNVALLAEHEMMQVGLGQAGSQQARNVVVVDKIRFHDRCGSLVKLSNGNRTAERRRPLDEFNNGVVMTHRPLRDSELFEIRIDRLVYKWSGSIEMGITTHNPNTLVFPATMTNMRSGTIMMSGCGILTNGKGTRREYGDFNLDELSEGDRVGMMRKPDGNLHYFINGLDQGVAAQRVPQTVWGVIDLYGMTIKVSIVERDEREEQNLITRRNTREKTGHQDTTLNSEVVAAVAQQDYYDRLLFHPNCGTHAQVINNGRTAHRPNAASDFTNAVVLTERPLKTGELFEVRLDRIVTKWAGSIEIGVTTHSPLDLAPFTMTNVRSGTWMMTNSGIMHNGTIVFEEYGVNLERLQVGDKIGVVRKENGLLHFFVNGVDQGAAAANVPELLYGVIDLYGQAAQASIMDMYEYGSPDTINSSLSNTTLYSDLRFHHVHGKNARIVNNGMTAMRPRPLSEFNDAIVFSGRPLRDGELFEICLDNIVDRWSGSIEVGVTAVRPDEIELPGTATDLSRATWMLSGTSVMENGSTIKNDYPCDLDALQSGTKIGVVRNADKTLEFFKDGLGQGVACIVPHGNVYAVVDLYGQCAQVSIPCSSPLVAPPSLDNCVQSDNSACLQPVVVVAQQQQQQQPLHSDLHLFCERHGQNVTLTDGARTAKRAGKELSGCIAWSASTLVQDEPMDLTIVEMVQHVAGSISVGFSETLPTVGATCLPGDGFYITGNELRHKHRILQLFAPNLNWLWEGDKITFLKTTDTIKVFVNGDDLCLDFPPLPDNLYLVVDLGNACKSVALISRKVSLLSPLTSVRLQDSLEIIDDSTGAELLDEDDIIASTTPSIAYDFHENRGRNVELLGPHQRTTVAKRLASYNQGMVVVQPALDVGARVRVCIEECDQHKWTGSLMVGVVAGPPERLALPINALAFKAPCCIVSEDWISINGAKSRSNYGQSLANLSRGDTVTVTLTSTGMKVRVNEVGGDDDEEDDGDENDVLHWELPPVNGQPLHAVFDLYGQCQQVRIVNEDDDDENEARLEKADLESCEKRMTLALPSTSEEGAAQLLNATTVGPPPKSPLLMTPTNPLTCTFREECVKIKSRLMLPDHYFTDEDPTCYCCSCHKSKSRNEKTGIPFEGWMKFPLQTPNNISTSTDKWHTAFYPTKIGTIRCILDKGQPLTKGQSQYGVMVARKEDDVQTVFYPTLLMHSKGFKYKNMEVHAAFQLLVKPNAYSISREPLLEWSTKETGAVVLHSLLLRF